jgi:predicted nucleic acid-binding Zn ribbon protein
MIEPLLGLRAALDRAIAVVQAVEPAVAAWEASRAGTERAQGAQERVEAAAGTPVAPNGSAPVLEPPTTPGEASEAAVPTRPCAVCGAPFPAPRRDGQLKRYCSANCRKASAAQRQREARATALAAAAEPEPAPEPAGPLADLPEPERPFRTPFTHPEDPEKARLLATAAALPWEVQP